MAPFHGDNTGSNPVGDAKPLKVSLRKKRAGIDEIYRGAQVCPVSNVIRPYTVLCDTRVTQEHTSFEPLYPRVTKQPREIPYPYEMLALVSY